MTDKTGLGDRMKRYEQVQDYRLISRMPVILRLDGRAFHTLTRKMDKPVDEGFVECMEAAALAVAAEVDGCTLGYFQSDEISLLVTDYRTYHTQPWFDYRVQKMCSIAASVATAAFNSMLLMEFPHCDPFENFDCRAFNLPKEEVCNYFIWRQRDATRNSISSLAQAHFSHKSLHGVSSDGMQDKLMLEKGINWNDCPIPQKRGACVVKREVPVQKMSGVAMRSEWCIDKEIPIFGQDRDYIDNKVNIEEGD